MDGPLQAAGIKLLQLLGALDRLAVGAGASAVGQGGPFGGQAFEHPAIETMAIEGGQSAPALHQVEGGHVLIAGTEIAQPQAAGHSVPGGRQKLIGTGGGTDVAAPHRDLRMAAQAGKQAAAVEQPIAPGSAAGPGAFRVADGGQQGPATGGEDIGTSADLLAGLAGSRAGNRGAGGWAGCWGIHRRYRAQQGGGQQQGGQQGRELTNRNVRLQWRPKRPWPIATSGRGGQRHPLDNRARSCITSAAQ